jgi:arginine deiminase
MYRLEGGDYVPDDEIAFIGVGLRTTIHSIDFMLQNNLFGK